jgi:IclR family transcriptional regulator, acetate operon repressor
MSKTLLRGLELIEEVGRHGPITVTELSRLTGVHITIVSRTVNALEPAGWLTKVDGKIVTGPRCAVVGLTSPVADSIREAEPLIGAIAGVAGLQAGAAGLVGGDLMTLASAGGEEVAGVPDGLLTRVPIYAMAAGRAVAAQLPAEKLDAVLPAEPFPDAAAILGAAPGSTALGTYLAGFGDEGEGAAALPRDRAALDAELERVRASGFARDRGELHPAVHCIAAPWPTASLPAALFCLGDRAAIEDAEPLINACLRAATRPGAGTREIVAAAAESPRPA